MVHAPPPGMSGGPSGPFRDRCGRCGGALRRTELTGKPQEEDHFRGCQFLLRALLIAQYVGELEQAASESQGQGAARGDRRRQRHLQKSAKELSAAACSGNPIVAIHKLADQYAAGYQRRAKPAETAEMLMQACRALAEGKGPAPIAPVAEDDA
jgi:hypothetical protein